MKKKNLLNFDDFVNENAQTDEWVVIDIQEGKPVSYWELLNDAFVDGLWNEAADQIIKNYKSWSKEGGEEEDEHAIQSEYEEVIDDFLSEYEEDDFSEIREFIKNTLGVENYTIHHVDEK